MTSVLVDNQLAVICVKGLNPSAKDIDQYHSAQPAKGDLGRNILPLANQSADYAGMAFVKATNLTHSHTMTPFDAPGNKPFENIVGKGEIARNEQFLLFPQCFLPIWINFCHFRQI